MKYRVVVGKYRAVHCRSLLTKTEFWRVYKDGVYDPLSDHATLKEARIKIEIYREGDKRRARQQGSGK